MLRPLLLLAMALGTCADPKGNITVYEVMPLPVFRVKNQCAAATADWLTAPCPPCRSQYKLDSAVADIQWVGTDRKTIYVRTQKSFIYRSGDEGQTECQFLPVVPS